MFKTSEKRLEYQREYWKKHKEQDVERGKAKRKRVKLEVFSHYSKGIPKCNRCGITDIHVLCIDHINGGGTKQRKEMGGGGRGGSYFYRWLRRNNYPGGFQVLCANCNLRKEIISDLALLRGESSPP